MVDNMSQDISCATTPFKTLLENMATTPAAAAAPTQEDRPRRQKAPARDIFGSAAPAAAAPADADALGYHVRGAISSPGLHEGLLL